VFIKIEREKLCSHASAFCAVDGFPVSACAVVCICAVSRHCIGLYRVLGFAVSLYIPPALSAKLPVIFLRYRGNYAARNARARVREINIYIAPARACENFGNVLHPIEYVSFKENRFFFAGGAAASFPPGIHGGTCKISRGYFGAGRRG